jgi:hypothetical protein
MSAFGTLWRIRTCRHIRTMHSLLKNTGEGRALWPRLQEAERCSREMIRLQARRRFHRLRGACQRRLYWP